MAAGRSVELVDLSARPLQLISPYYTPSLSVTPPPPSELTPPSTSPQSPTSAHAPPHDIITAQIRHALTGNFPHSPSIASMSTVSTASIPSETREHLFRNCLSASTVDIDELRRIIWAHGTPSAPWARPLAWKLLTGYLPPDSLDWHSHLSNMRAHYWTTVHDVTVDPSHRPNPGDHPLNDADNSQWKEYFHDTRIRKAIQLDVNRTHPDLHRFTPLRDHLERVLFVFAKQHPELGYIQGMNELASPFLLVFNDGRAIDPSDAEADAYFCFKNVMDEMHACYNRREADTKGINRQVRELQALLRIKDPVLESHFERLGIDARFYGLRWIKLWLTREFCLPDLLALWDSFLTSEVRLPWIRYVCVAMAIRIRDQFLTSDFAKCMKMLLNYPPCDIAELLRIADRLRTSNVVIVRTARR